MGNGDQRDPTSTDRRLSSPLHDWDTAVWGQVDDRKNRFWRVCVSIGFVVTKLCRRDLSLSDGDDGEEGGRQCVGSRSRCCCCPMG